MAVRLVLRPLRRRRRRHGNVDAIRRLGDAAASPVVVRLAVGARRRGLSGRGQGVVAEPGGGAGGRAVLVDHQAAVVAAARGRRRCCSSGR